VLSTRNDVIPASVAQELSRLQDQVSPAPWPQIEAVLTEELGAPPDQVFADFTKEPLAAASVAQVYAAELDGVQVVVKVQRPGIASVVDRVAGRMLSGLAEGLLDVALMVLVARALPAVLRPSMFSLFAAMWILPSVLGPPCAVPTRS
jgi:hypothetical protein